MAAASWALAMVTCLALALAYSTSPEKRAYHERPTSIEGLVSSRLNIGQLAGGLEPEKTSDPRPRSEQPGDFPSRYLLDSGRLFCSGNSTPAGASCAAPASEEPPSLTTRGSGLLVSISGATAGGAAGSSVSVRRSRSRVFGLGRVAGLWVSRGAAIFLARVVFLVRFVARLLPRLRTTAAFLDRRERLGAALAIETGPFAPRVTPLLKPVVVRPRANGSPECPRSDEAELAVNVAARASILEDLFPTLVGHVGLHLHGSTVCLITHR